jgi:photosystem II stability/assembly factor-like uncharacterized protein
MRHHGLTEILAACGFAAFLMGCFGEDPASGNPAPPDPDNPPVETYGWKVSVPANAGNTIPNVGYTAVHFVSLSTGWIAGRAGNILKTENGGVSWSAQITGTTQPLTDIQFADASRGWAAGYGGVLLTTANGGATWTLRASGTTQNLRSLHFPNDTVGYAAGDNSTVLKTTNGGATWVPLPTGSAGYDFYAVVFATAQKGWVAGSSGLVLATTDGGANWVPQIGPSGSSRFRALALADSLKVWTVYDPALRYTVDGGASWTGVTSTNLWTGSDLQAAQFISPQKGWAVGAKVYKTADGGSNWTRHDISMGSTYKANGVFFMNDSIGWIVTESGGVFKTSDGGSTWAGLFKGGLSPQTSHLNRVLFTDSSTGWIVGGSGMILKTTNAGETWETKSSGVTEGLTEIDFVGTQLGWIAGEGGVILKTTNGGETWIRKTIPTAAAIRSMDFGSAAKGLAISKEGTMRTTDGGESWILTPVGSIYAGQFAARMTDSAIAFRSTMFDGPGDVGTSYIEKSVDGGVTWNSLASLRGNYYSRIFPWNKDTLYAILNGGIARSVNGGSTFLNQSVAAPGMAAVHFADPVKGWAVGAGGNILATADGGYSGWVLQSSPTTENLNSVFFTGSRRGWAVGNNGIILKYVGAPD